MSNKALYQEPKNGDFVTYIDKMQQGQIANLKSQAYLDNNAQASAIAKANMHAIKSDSNKTFRTKNISEHNKKVSQKHNKNVKKSFEAMQSNINTAPLKQNTRENSARANVDVFTSPYNRVSKTNDINVAKKILPLFAIISLVLAFFVDPFFAVFFIIIMVAYSNIKARSKRDNKNHNISQR